MIDRQYCLITPCRDEAKYARRTLDSVIAQTLPPAMWIIVDDGSTDETPRILAEYAAKHPWVRVVTRPNRGYRKVGGGVIDAFYAGYNSIDPDEFAYVCKLDLDIELPPRYFESLVKKMEAEPRLGTCSGKPYMLLGGRLAPEICGDEHCVGMVKFYRTECLKQIGGFVPEVMWDGIDGHRCRMLGWIAKSTDDEQLRFLHLRPMGTSHRSWWTGRVRHGSGQYFMGAHPVYTLASAIFRTTRPPILVGGVAILWGYLKAMLSGKPRYADTDFRRFLRRYQWSCLLQGKSKATTNLNQQQAPKWQPGKPHWGARSSQLSTKIKA